MHITTFSSAGSKNYSMLIRHVPLLSDFHGVQRLRPESGHGGTTREKSSIDATAKLWVRMLELEVAPL
jgi:hypothetical protein